ncbi:MAG: hypothetical protein K2O03_01790 [Lachnospiraceae bacterium]|nr:hypothetical protein [Lachnospiraceae bacterium]
MPIMGVGREYAELKNSILPDNAPLEFIGAKRREIPMPVMGVGREYAELKIRRSV